MMKKQQQMMQVIIIKSESVKERERGRTTHAG
jgi:hypothetical protein